MEMPSSSNSLFKVKGVGGKRIDFSDVSFLHTNPSFDTVTKKRKLSGEEPTKKRQKIATTKVKPFTAFKSETTNPEDATRVEKSVTVSWVEPQMKPKPSEGTEKQSCSMRDLIAKAKSKVQEKRRRVDERKAELESMRLAARLVRDKIVQTVDTNDHLQYHRELEQLGCPFIRDQVSCLLKFSLISR